MTTSYFIQHNFNRWYWRRNLSLPIGEQKSFQIKLLVADPLLDLQIESSPCGDTGSHQDLKEGCLES